MRTGAKSILICIVAGSVSASARAQDTVFFPPTSHVAIRAMRMVPTVDLNDRVHLHTVVGATGSVSFGDLDSGGVAPLHHHTREQVNVGLTSTFQVTVGNHVEVLPAGYGLIIPADVNHSFANPGPTVASAIEFHTIPRPDLVPPRPKLSFPASAAAVVVRDDQRLVTRMDTPAGKTLNGRTCTVAWRSIRSTIDAHPQPTATELFVYVARGAVELSAEGHTANVPEGSLVIIPAKLAHARMRSIGQSSAAVIEFQVHK